MGQVDESYLFTWVDYTMLAATVAASLGIGMYQSQTGGKQRTTEEYLMGNRKMRVFPIAVSLTVSYISAISIIGYPAEIYYYGITFWFLFVGGTVGTLFAAFCFVPVFYPLRMTSVNEYLYHRFDSKMVVVIGWFLQILSQVMYIGIVLYAPATMVEIMSGFPMWGSMLLMGTVGTLYTTFGGLKAVVWTDFFQAVVILAGLLTIVIKGTILTGGPTEVWLHYRKGGRAFLDFSPSVFRRQTVWTMLTAGFMQTSMMYTISQTGVQRYSAVPSLKSAKAAMLWTLLPFLTIQTLGSLSGIVAFAYFEKQGCEPLAAGFIPSPNQIMPYLVMRVLNYPGVPGVFCACVLCGSLSNLSTSLSAITALTWSDLMVDKLQHVSDIHKTVITKIMTALYGLAGLGFGFIFSNFGGTLMQIAVLILGGIGAPQKFLFVGGLLFPRLNSKSVIVGTLVAMAISILISAGSLSVKAHQSVLPSSTSGCLRNSTVVDEASIWYTSPFTTEVPGDGITSYVNYLEEGNEHGWKRLFQISHYWIVVLGLAAGFVVSLLTSLLPGFHRTGRVNPDLHFPCIRAGMAKKERCEDDGIAKIKGCDMNSNEENTKV